MSLVTSMHVINGGLGILLGLPGILATADDTRGHKPDATRSHRN
jgi:hypothetical protein